MCVLELWGVAWEQREVHGEAFGRPAQKGGVIGLRWDRQHREGVPAGEPFPLLPGVKGEMLPGVGGLKVREDIK